MTTWFEFDADVLWRAVLSAGAMLLWAIVVIRIVGLRSLSKISSFDFVVTVALGSVTATTAVTTTSLWTGLVAFAALLGAQWIIARLRIRTPVDRFVDNEPLLLMLDAVVLHENLRRARVTQDDLWAKLREAGVRRIDDVLAVVMETTGDVSVIVGEGPLDARLLRGVRHK